MVNIGDRFGMLVVVEQADDQISPSGRKRHRYNCRCDCGTYKIINGENLQCGYTQSCGCLQKKRARDSRCKHGCTDSRLYNVWCAMKRRCYNKSCPEFRVYGARGIYVCDSWKNDYVEFSNWAHANGYIDTAPRGECTIDRIDVNGNYTPENCRIVNQTAQMNNVSYNRIVHYGDRDYTIAELAREFKMPYYLVRDRIVKYGWDVDSAITLPPHARRCIKKYN